MKYWEFVTELIIFKYKYLRAPSFNGIQMKISANPQTHLVNKQNRPDEIYVIKG